MSGLRFAVRVICTGCGHRQDLSGAATDFEPALANGRWPEGTEPSCPTCGALTFDPTRLRMPDQRSLRTMYRQGRDDDPDQRGAVRLTIRAIPTHLR